MFIIFRRRTKKKCRKSFILTHSLFVKPREKAAIAPTKTIVKEQLNKTQTQGPKSTIAIKAQKVILKKSNPAFINKIKKGGLSGLSINQFLNKKEDGGREEEYKIATGESRSDFHQDKLNPLWLEYAKNIEAKGKVSLFRLFSDQLPKIDDDFLLHFPLESQALADDLQVEKPELLSFLRLELNNYGINLDFPII